MKIYETMRQPQPDFFIHCGDTIYADGPMRGDGDASPTATSSGATRFSTSCRRSSRLPRRLHEYPRATISTTCYDANVRRFNAEVPQIWQWDDHEVTNNWSDSKDCVDARYTEKRVQTLVAQRARGRSSNTRRMRWHSQEESERVYRHIPYGRDLDVFVHRHAQLPRAEQLQPAETPSAETAFLGRAQIEWLKRQAQAVARDVEDHRRRHAARPAGAATARTHRAARGSRTRQRRRARARPRVRDRRPAALHQARRRRERRVAHRRRALLRRALLRSGARRSSRTSIRSGSSCPAARTRAPSAPTPSTTRSARRWSFRRRRRPGRANLPPSAGLQFFGQVDIDPRSKEHDRCAQRHQRRHGVQPAVARGAR